MTAHEGPDAINNLTVAQETAPWDRQRTNDELRDFVDHHLGRLAISDDLLMEI